MPPTLEGFRIRRGQGSLEFLDEGSPKFDGEFRKRRVFFLVTGSCQLGQVVAERGLEEVVGAFGVATGFVVSPAPDQRLHWKWK